MKTKTIRKIIRAKVDEWLASIEDQNLRGDLSQGIVVTGGCIASMLLKEKVNDFDIYFRTRELTIRAAQYYVDRFHPQAARGIPAKITVDTSLPDRVGVKIQSDGIASEEGTEDPYEYFEGRPADEAGRSLAGVMDDPGEIEDLHDEIEEGALENTDPGYRPVFMSTNAITLSNRVQLITRFYGEPDQIHENYDFVHCTNYWRSWGPASDELTLKLEALESLMARDLRYVGSRYPLCSIIRLRKFIARGWTVNAGQILKMVMQLQELNLKDMTVLRDQLTGVDAAYFMQLMSLLKEKDPEKVNAAYLVEIIDRLF